MTNTERMGMIAEMIESVAEMIYRYFRVNKEKAKELVKYSSLYADLQNNLESNFQPCNYRVWAQEVVEEYNTYLALPGEVILPQYTLSDADVTVFLSEIYDPAFEFHGDDDHSVSASKGPLYTL